MNLPDREGRPVALVTGMAANTPLGDSPDAVLDALMAGRSGISPWRGFEVPPMGARIGGELGGYDVAGKLASLPIPADVLKRTDRMLRRVPWAARLSLLVAAEAAIGARWWSSRPVTEDAAVIVAGHNFSPRTAFETWKKFQEEPDYIDALAALHVPDTNHAACVSELLASKGSLQTVGAACASGNYAVRAALDEIADGAAIVMVVAPIYEYGPTTLQALGRMRATTDAATGDAGSASRPFDAERDGFVPSHGAAAIVIESAAHAAARGVDALAEIVATEASTDACHRPPRPSPEQQAALIRGVLASAGIAPSDLDLVSAHAASTPAGDLAEGRAIAHALGPDVAINAVKSMLGHTGWSAALVELVIAIAEMRRGEVHGTANLRTPDPEIRLNLVSAGARPARTVLNNAFGFGGLNCVSLLRRVG
jgi:3-oxoacyl-(acyl-carrier-protein) synthase